MKVDLNGADGQNLSEIRASQSGNTTPARTSSTDSDQAVEDRTTLTSDGSAVETLTARVLTSSEVRQEKVEALRQAVMNGDYEIDAGKIAEAMIRDSE